MRRTQRETWNDLRVKVMPKVQYMQEEIKNLRQKQINNYASPSSIYRSPAPSVDNNNTSMRNRAYKVRGLFHYLSEGALFLLKKVCSLAYSIKSLDTGLYILSLF